MNAYPLRNLKTVFVPLSAVEGSNKNVPTALDVTFLVQFFLLGHLTDIQ